MALEIIDLGNLEDVDPDYFGSRGVGGLGLPIVIPVFYIIGTSAISGATMAWAWLNRDEWSTAEYNDNMKRINESLTLWDQLAWKNPGEGKNACWKKNASKRSEWLNFWKRFSAFYKKNGTQSYYLPDNIEKEARRLVRELAVWGEWLEKKCNISTIIGQSDKKDEEDKSDFEKTLKYGAWIVGGIVVLNLISSFRDITRQR